MGQQARTTVEERFSLTRFKHAFLRSIEIARRKWHTRKINPATTESRSLKMRNWNPDYRPPYASMSMRPAGTPIAAGNSESEIRNSKSDG